MPCPSIWELSGDKGFPNKGLYFGVAGFNSSGTVLEHTNIDEACHSTLARPGLTGLGRRWRRAVGRRCRRPRGAAGRDWIDLCGSPSAGPGACQFGRRDSDMRRGVPAAGNGAARGRRAGGSLYLRRRRRGLGGFFERKFGPGRILDARLLPAAPWPLRRAPRRRPIQASRQERR